MGRLRRVSYGVPSISLRIVLRSSRADRNPTPSEPQMDRVSCMCASRSGTRGRVEDQSRVELPADSLVELPALCRAVPTTCPSACGATTEEEVLLGFRVLIRVPCG